MNERFVVDVSGRYSPASGRVEVKGPEDLVKNGISVSPDAVAATWGAEAAQRYQVASAEARAKKAAEEGAAQPAPNA